MRAVYRRPPRLIVRQFLVWFTWFLLSGYIFHDRTERELRALPPLEAIFRIGSLVIVATALYWLLVIMPANVRTFLATGGAVGFALGALPIAVQALVTKYLEFRQVWP